MLRSVGTQFRVGANDFRQDVIGLGGPDEGLGLLVAIRDVVLDGCDEFRDAAEYTAAEASHGQVT